MATVTSHYARAALSGAQRQGLDTEQLIAKAGISAELLAAADGRVHADQLTQLIQAIWAELGDEFMGFTQRPCKPGSFAMMSELVSRCDTLDALFHQGIRFYQLLTNDISMQYCHVAQGRELIVTMSQQELDPEKFYLEFWLVIWHRFASWILGQQIKLQAAYFSYPQPAHFSEFQYQFACPCYFDAQETKLCFSQQYASLPPLRTQRELAQFLKNSPADLMTIPGNDNSVTLAIKTLLLNDAEKLKKFPDLDELAASVAMSSQTLRRKLKSEGSSYQKIKDAVRCDIAVEKLSVQQMAVSDVAELLGFSESRSFTRAFKQ